ncbi:MAG: hypothetical protein M0R03_14415 [Novosphingobium sp.]|nr:hypothetical protein [Novosphingobium sp.]
MKSPFKALPNSSILESLENLGALNGDNICLVKPFKDWKVSSWREKIFHFRLCNVGEGLEILEELSKAGSDSKAQLTKIYILSKAIYMIDNAFPIEPEELKHFNETHKFHLNQTDYLVEYFKNIEQIILDRLDAVYAALQRKQIRQLQGLSICDGCGETFSVIPHNSKRLLYSVSEIICNDCVESADLSNYEFEEDVKKIEPKKIIKEEKTQAYKCPHCELELKTFEELNDHLPECEKLPIHP